MSTNDYIKEMEGNTPSNIGILLGKAIKDSQVKPDEYKLICDKLRKDGFKFVNIQFQ